MRVESGTWGVERTRGLKLSPFRFPLSPLLSPVIALILIVSAAPLLSAAPWQAAPFARPHPSVGRVSVVDREGMSLGSGSLVAVDQRLGLVLTCWHVIQDAAGPIVVSFPDGFRSAATVVRTDREWDLAALAIHRPPAQPIAISPRSAAGRSSWCLPATAATASTVPWRAAARSTWPRKGTGRWSWSNSMRSPAGRLGRPDLQQPRRAGRRAVGLGLWTNVWHLLRPRSLVFGLGRRRFPSRFLAGGIGPPIEGRRGRKRGFRG